MNPHLLTSSSTAALRLLLLAAVLLFARASPAQTTQPALSTIDLGNGFLIDIPSYWTQAPRPLLSSTFTARSGATVTDVFFHAGGKPTELPYATLEYVGALIANPTQAQQRQLADQVAAYYATAFNPPSKADRPPLFKSATVSPVVFDPVSRRFTFSVVVKYDMIGALHVDVLGCFDANGFMLCSVWSDDAYHAEHATQLLAMRDSLRLGTRPSARASSMAIVKRTAQVAAALAVAVLVAIQIVVLLRARRERKAEDARWLG